MDRSLRENPEAVLVNDYGEFDFVGLGAMLWREKLLFLAIVGAFVVASITYAMTATQWYRAQIVVIPADTDPMGGLGSQLGALGGLAGLAGISLGSNNNSEPMAVLQSDDFARAFIEQENLLPILFAERWDAAAMSWKSNDPKNQPDLRDGVRVFDDVIRSVQEESRTGTITLAIQWTDPSLAAKWANLLIDKVNSNMRAKALAEAQANIDYLRQELDSSGVVTLQQSIGRLLDSELQKMMMARGKDEYAFKVIDRAEEPKWRFRPKRAQTVIAAAVFGALIAIMVIMSRASLRRRTETVKADSAGSNV